MIKRIIDIENQGLALVFFQKLPSANVVD